MCHDGYYKNIVLQILPAANPTQITLSPPSKWGNNQVLVTYPTDTLMPSYKITKPVLSRCK